MSNEKNPQMTEREIIDETLRYYYNEGNYGIFGFAKNRCEYLTREGKKCAVGRCLIPGDYLNASGPVIALVKSLKKGYYGKELSLDDVMEERYRGHSERFWQSLQKVHDTWARNLAIGQSICAVGRITLRCNFDALLDGCGIVDPPQEWMEMLSIANNTTPEE